MDGYKHYIRTDADNIVTHGFSDAFEEPLETDILIAEDAGRHYNPVLRNDRGQYIYEWDGTQLVERSQADLDLEWAARPPDPPSDKERLQAIEDTITALLGL